MTKKVVILTAGSGSRLNQRTKFFNKAILKVGDKAAISHIIDLFPAENEFVIGLGHLGEIVREYLTIAHPDRTFQFVEIDKYSVPGAGPGYALMACKQHLQEPFFFVACDTVTEAASFHASNDETQNYIAWDTVPLGDIEKYCTLRVSDGQVIEWLDKLPDGTEKAFTGLAHIRDWQDFWKAMECNKRLLHEEIQISPAIASLSNVRAKHMKWHDVGSEHGLLAARKHYAGIQNLDKLDEELYVVNHKVIKYFYDAVVIQKRLERTKMLNNLVPKIQSQTPHFFSYDFVIGEDMFERNDIVDLLPHMLEKARQELWTEKFSCKHPDDERFREACNLFYKEKTVERFAKFLKKTNVADVQEIINGNFTQKMEDYLCLINWEQVCQSAIPSGFHGDFQPGNIIVDLSKEFKFIDWRQDFGGLINVGDRYYDFAKLYTSFLMPHPSIKANKFSLIRSRGEIFINVFVDEQYKDCIYIFEQWLTKNFYSIKHVQLLAAIVLLNMSPLHESPLDQWLYYSAKALFSHIFPNRSFLETH